MKERTEISGDPHRIFIFSRKPLLGASEKISLEGGSESGPGARAAVAAAVAAERAMLVIYCTVQQLRQGQCGGKEQGKGNSKVCCFRYQADCV